MTSSTMIDERNADTSMIEACRQGDREAFRRLFDAYKDRVYSMAVYALHGDAVAAEDVTQEVFLRVFTRIRQFRGESEFATWLYRLVANACVDEQRRHRRCVLLADIADGESRLSAPSEAAALPDFEFHDAVQIALAALSPEIRMTVLLKYYEELSYDEMAQALRCSKGTIASRLNRGLKTLARKLAHLNSPTVPGE